MLRPSVVVPRLFMTLTDPPHSTVADIARPVRASTAPPAAPPAPPSRPGARRGLTAGFGAGSALTLERVLVVIALGASVVGVALRFVTDSALWLDEALTVDISRLPTSQLLGALRHDGAPPAYYLMLHVWMKVFGQSDLAVRMLPALISVATLPVAWALGRALGGRQVALAAVVFVATSPFAIRYGTENRMYSLVMFLAVAGGLALVKCLRDPTPIRLVALGLIGGLLLLTHYWALYLVAATGAVLLVSSVRGANRSASRLTLAALVSGSLLFVPWAPSFLFQALHTGTPWATPPSPLMLFDAVGQFAGWYTGWGSVLFGIYCLSFAALAALVVVSNHPRARGIAAWLGLRCQPPGERWAAPVAAIGIGTLVLAFVGGSISGAALAFRYASVVFPAFELLCALGVAAIGITRGGRRLAAGLLAAAALIGVPVGANESLANRTEAGLVANRIRSVAHSGDVIAYCPDQLGPAVSRLLPNRYLQVTYPRFDPPQLIDWVDYAKVNAKAPAPGVAARELVNLAGPTHQVWLVWQQGYRTFGNDCEELRDSLLALRPNFTEPVRSAPSRYYEHESLDRFAPS